MSARLVVRALSELCVTLGTLIVLFVVYVLFWTGVRADGAMGDELERLEERWASATPAPGGSGEPFGPGASSGPGASPAASERPAKPAAYRDGEAFAVMYVPRFGEEWAKPVLQGTKTDTLKKGLGRYARTVRLGAVGNFSVAGHRRTYGDPFKDFPRLREGDAVVLRDRTTWSTYRIVNKPYKTFPSDVEVVGPVPLKPGFVSPGRYLTLTTCDPEWGHSHRLIVWARLDSTQPVDDGEPAALRG